MRRIIPFRLPAFVFGAGIAAALTFGASSVVAMPQRIRSNRTSAAGQYPWAIVSGAAGSIRLPGNKRPSAGAARMGVREDIIANEKSSGRRRERNDPTGPS
jgi:hypothetical protein